MDKEKEEDEELVNMTSPPAKERKKKPKRKKFTPKLMPDFNIVKTPKTPVKTPVKTSENPSGKRKYTRKARAPAVAPSVKRGLIFEDDDDGKHGDSNESIPERKSSWGLCKRKRSGIKIGIYNRRRSGRKIGKEKRIAWGDEVHSIFDTQNAHNHSDEDKEIDDERSMPSCCVDGMNCCCQPSSLAQKEFGCRTYGPQARVELLMAKQFRCSKKNLRPSKRKRAILTDSLPRDDNRVVDPCTTVSSVEQLAISKPTRRGRPKRGSVVPIDSPPSNANKRIPVLRFRVKDLSIIIQRLKHLNINGYRKAQNALVPYVKKKITAKVEIDAETSREWERLMGNESIENDGPEAEADREEYWKREREKFHAFVYSFIERMEQILGNRKFSRWKGSVVDSVVGVFLTQNVSDFLSSNAFLGLMARFPPQSKAGNNTDDVEPISKRLAMDNTQSQVPSPDIASKCADSENRVPQNNVNSVERESNLRNEPSTSENISYKNLHNSPAGKGVKSKMGEKAYDWESLRKQTLKNGIKKERSKNTTDSLDYEAMLGAKVEVVAGVIRKRGQHRILAKKIMEFLQRVKRDHGSVDLEWLRDILPDEAKDYLMSIYGVGPKSTDCVCLLCLGLRAFPVDTNVGRIMTRLGFAKLQPLPESVQLHLLETYPLLDKIQRYLWPRLCKLDHETLYKLHYLLITFGKVFCTKSKPNCNACPMRGECKHFASAYLRANHALPEPQQTSLVRTAAPVTFEESHDPAPSQISLVQLEGSALSDDRTIHSNCEPIIEEPATPEHECLPSIESDLEDIGDIEDACKEIPTVKINMEAFKQNLQSRIQEMNASIQDGDMSKALMSITPEAAYIPMPKLKDKGRLRTLHHVYVLRKEDRIFLGLEKLDSDDRYHYLLAIWTPGETAQSIEPSQLYCSSPNGSLCYESTCRRCNGLREAQAGTVRGTILIPVRTATRGSFPLNGTYFQCNEVFADHQTSHTPINFPMDRLFQMERAFVCCGKTVSSMLKGFSTDHIQYIFWKGYLCVRAFDRATRRPKDLAPRLHVSPTEETKMRGKNQQRAKTSIPQQEDMTT